MQRYYGNHILNSLIDDLGSDLIFKQQLNLAEHNIYGSSRLGVKQDTTQIHFSRFTASSIDTITGAIIKDSILYQSTAQADSLNSQRVLGFKSYELSNHLGNVLAVVSDKRIYISDTIISGDTFALWDAHITSAQDYYPFGMLMPNRHWVESDSSAYKYGFNGQERDDEVNGIGNSYTATYWQYDGRLGRRWNVDPAFRSFTSISTYSVLMNNPIMCIDPNGDSTVYVDSKGNVLLNSGDDGLDNAIVFIDDDALDNFNQLIEEAGDQAIGNKGFNEQLRLFGTGYDTESFIEFFNNTADRIALTNLTFMPRDGGQWVENYNLRAESNTWLIRDITGMISASDENNGKGYTSNLPFKINFYDMSGTDH